MASRRVRIKGIANIPQRRKPSTANNDEDASEQTSEPTQPSPIKDQTENNNDPLPDAINNSHDVTEKVIPKRRNIIKPAVNLLNNRRVKIEEEDQNLQSKIDEAAPALIKNRVYIKPVVNVPLNCKETITPDEIIDDVKPLIPIRRNFIKPAVNLVNNNRKLDEVVPVRRNFIKPTVNLVNNRRVKNEEENQEPIKEIPEVNVNLNEISLPVCNGDALPAIEKRVEPLGMQPVNHVIGIVKLPKPQYIEGSKSGSDTEYPPPASSPSKFANRARIKAVPRLGQQRRTSFTIGSASESEDESKRTYNRIRNDSVCSAASGTLESQQFDASTRKEFSSVIQRKCRRTEQSRRLAEARRDFYMKYSNGHIDRQKLTMLDLIFYNPATSPMSQKKKRRLDTETESLPADLQSEIIDDPIKPIEIKPPPIEIKLPPPEEPASPPSDEENTVPAPQITIGANGEIVIDEKSLVIENKETTKNREALKQSQIVDGDFDSGYGVYKRVKRSRDWSKDETLRFYKALNTIGTDFTMMGELFPDRNRKELKMKFKKEERVNRALIDRAVMQPIQFDMTALRRDVEIAKLEKEEAERCRKEKEQYKQDSSKKKRSRKDSMYDDMDLNDTAFKLEKRAKQKRTNRQMILKSGMNSLCGSDSDDSVSTYMSSRSKTKVSDSDDENEEQHVGKVQTTRSGRISKPKVSKEEIIEPEEQSVDGEEEHLTPGSLMIVTETDENNETVHKIFSVDENGKKVPIVLTSEVLANLTQEHKSEDDDDDDEAEANTTTQDVDTTVDKIIDNNLTSLNCTDIIIGDNSMIIPFDEYDEQMMQAAENADQSIQVAN